MAELKHVTIKKSDLDKIITYAFRELPDEACGMIGGFDHEDGTREIKEVYLMTNVDHTNEHFSMDPREQLAVIKDIRSKGYQLLGNWHSHPESPSRSSQEDIRLAFDSKVSYLILSLMDREHPVLNSFHCEGGISTKESLTIVD
ncbi:MAG: M67 family metallopeptidase [Lachnospiraceae bacterium]|nr:M67 family metallopeptidase [Lachnospiraceae bacterium]